jgi:hypothetical protein
MEANFRFGIIERLSVAAFIAGVAGVVASMSLPAPYQEFLAKTGFGPYLFWGSMLAIASTVAFFVGDLALYFLNRRSAKLGLVVLGTAMIIVGGVVGLIGAFRVDNEHALVGPNDASPFNLANYFVKDFNLLSIDRTAQVRVQNPSNGLDQTIEVKIRIFRDFDSNSEFVATFIPQFGDVRLSEATEQFIDNLRPQIKQAREDAKLIGVQAKTPGSALASSKDLVFSGRVFLYTVNSLDPIQLGHLVESYRNDGMYLEVRGTDYMLFRQARH